MSQFPDGVLESQEFGISRHDIISHAEVLGQRTPRGDISLVKLIASLTEGQYQEALSQVRRERHIPTSLDMTSIFVALNQLISHRI